MHKLPDVMILCGGLGTRLKEVTGGSQKTLAEITDKPFLHFLIDILAAQGLERFILCAGYKSEDIRAYFDNQDLGIEIAYSIEQRPLGTAGAVSHAVKLVNTEHFLVLNGDSFCRIDYVRLINEHIHSKCRLTIAAALMKDTQDYGLLEIDTENRIRSFREKEENASGYVNAGVYCMDTALVGEFPKKTPLSLEKEVFPERTESGINAYITGQPFYDIGTPERFLEAKEVLKTDE